MELRIGVLRHAWRGLLLAAVLLVAWPATAQTQFRWVDANGKVNFGDNPPRDARNLQSIGTSRPPSAAPLDGLPFEVRRVAEQFPVTLYTTASCGPCDAGRALLRARGVPYAEFTIGTIADRDAFVRMNASEQVPLLQVGAQRTSGFERATWDGLLTFVGYPVESRLPTAWQPPAPRPLVEPARPAEPAAP